MSSLSMMGFAVIGVVIVFIFIGSYRMDKAELEEERRLEDDYSKKDW